MTAVPKLKAFLSIGVRGKVIVYKPLMFVGYMVKKERRKDISPNRLNITTNFQIKITRNGNEIFYFFNLTQL